VIVTLVILIVALFVAADRIAVAYAQNMIASKIQSQANLSVKPSVTIEGFPFLTQIAAHDLTKVDISASNVVENRVTISSIKATAAGVHLNSGFDGATIDQINGTALITYQSLESVIGIPGATIAPAPAAGPNGITISEDPLGSATATVTLTSPTTITVHVTSLNGLASLLAGPFGQSSSYVLTIPTLPVGLMVTSVSVASQGVMLQAAAHNTSLSQ
jgi:LmeA-like phospholipid-binding